MYNRYNDVLIPDEKIDPQVFLELNIGKIETKELFEAEPEPRPDPVIILANTKEEGTFESRTQLVKALKQLDIGVGAVVTKRVNYPSTRTMPLYWGIVTNMVVYCHDKINHAPYMVRWIDGTISYHKYYELILISLAPDEDELQLIRMEPDIKEVDHV